MSDDNDEYEYSDEDDDDEYEEDQDEDADWTMSDGALENPNAAPTQQGKGPEIRMLSSSELVPIMKRRLKDVTEVLGVPTSAATVLLRHYHWNKERLVEVYLTSPDKTQHVCGVYGRCHREEQYQQLLQQQQQRNNNNHYYPSRRKRGLCEICYDQPVDLLTMPCQHGFCQDCWAGYIENAVETEGPNCVTTMTCPHDKCPEVITEEEVHSFASPALAQKYEAFQLRSFVETNSATRWCPGPGCDKVAMHMGSHMSLMGDHHFSDSYSGSSSSNSIIAKCGDCETIFCLACGEEPHAPTTCKELATWNEKCRNESETANWILANTKACPQCSSRIEKNQGCNHMTCRQCKHEFCWICMGTWSNHGANTGGYYKCNKFDDDNNNNGMEDESDAAKAKRELDRYLHYYKRFHAHAEAQKFAQRQLHETEARMVMLQESNNNAKWTDVEFLKHANLQLIECRRVLKYTYAYAYYLVGGNSNGGNKSKERFEHHQEMLEKFTESLSEQSEKPLAEMDRVSVVNHTRVVKNFMKNILQYVEDGMEED